jgi:hypothetical protein
MIWALLKNTPGNEFLRIYTADSLGQGSWSSLWTPATHRMNTAYIAWDTVSNRVHILYVKQGNTPKHICFNRNNSTWVDNLRCPPLSAGNVSANDMVWVRYNGASYLYLLRDFGGSSKNFMRYNVVANSWDSTICQLPSLMWSGAAICWDGNTQTDSGCLYAFSGGDYNQHLGWGFWKYSIKTNSWTRKNGPTEKPSVGSLAYRKRQSGGDLIYALIRLDRKYFAQYNVSSNSWQYLADTPRELCHGAALIYMPALRRAFAFRGGSNKDFWRYVPSNEDEGTDWGELSAGFDAFDDEEEEINVFDPGWSKDGQWVVFPNRKPLVIIKFTSGVRMVQKRQQ